MSMSTTAGLVFFCLRDLALITSKERYPEMMDKFKSKVFVSKIGILIYRAMAADVLYSTVTQYFFQHKNVFLYPGHGRIDFQERQEGTTRHEIVLLPHIHQSPAGKGAKMKWLKFQDLINISE